jgi:hypothetical protein
VRSTPEIEGKTHKISNESPPCSPDATSSQLPAPNCQLSTPNCPLPTASSQLSTARSQVPTASSQVPTASSQLLATQPASAHDAVHPTGVAQCGHVRLVANGPRPRPEGAGPLETALPRLACSQECPCESGRSCKPASGGALCAELPAMRWPIRKLHLMPGADSEVLRAALGDLVHLTPEIEGQTHKISNKSPTSRLPCSVVRAPRFVVRARASRAGGRASWSVLRAPPAGARGPRPGTSAIG